MRNPTPSRRRARLIRSAALAILLTGVLSVPSSAVPEPPVPDQVPMAAAAAPQALPDVPGAEYLFPVAETSDIGGTTTASQVTVANRPRMAIEFGPDDPVWSVLYVYEHNVPIDNPTETILPCPGTPRPDAPPCVPDPFFQPACASADNPVTQRKVGYYRNRIYPVLPLDGGGADVGFVAQKQLNLAAFGSVPASATLTLRVPIIDGHVQYLMNHLWDASAALAGRPDAEGCDPAFNDTAPRLTALVEGDVTLQLSDLKVDGVPVNVGDHCRTVRPAKLELWGDMDRGGYFPLSGGVLGMEPGLSDGTLFPLEGRLYRDDEGREFGPSHGLEVPPFTGCGSGGDDLSALVTAMASGPDNRVRLEQKQVTFLDEIPIEDLTRCGVGICPLPAPEVPERPRAPWENEGTP